MQCCPSLVQLRPIGSQQGVTPPPPSRTATTEPPANVTINGVVVSTDPSEWTGLTLKQIVQLKLKPKSMDEMNKKAMRDRSNVDAGYYGTEFNSEYSDEYHFFVQYLGYVPAGRIAYYILARPNSDTVVYTTR